eukprot:TRINITY_DN4461_c0_g2_i1.p1 TRINITY_DN4461_c0_g2~~TRINITY_DN4461_c0_g2_i1.p1  ORF type:complete len:290 (-),score=46.19 TRINITY_DN4461_c0_g2_i1:72-812(-)
MARALCSEINSPTIFRCLSDVGIQTFNLLTGRERIMLLQWFSDNICTRDVVANCKFIRSLPLFETNPAQTPDFLANMAARVLWDNLELFPDLDPDLIQQVVDFGVDRFVQAKKVSLLPNGVPRTNINKQFLLYRPEFKTLYQNLRIQVLNRALYFKSYAIPKFNNLSKEEKYSLMEFVRANFVTMCSEMKDLPQILSNMAFVETRGDRKEEERREADTRENFQRKRRKSRSQLIFRGYIRFSWTTI